MLCLIGVYIILHLIFDMVHKVACPMRQLDNAESNSSDLWRVCSLNDLELLAWILTSRAALVGRGEGVRGGAVFRNVCVDGC